MSSPTSKPAGADEIEPRADVIAGDHVFFNHPSGPLSGRVTACGAHGATLDVGGVTHKIKWPHILGHKKRNAQSYTVADSGEDGHIITDASGQRRYLAVPNEALEDPLMVKSESPGAKGAKPSRILMLKAGKKPGGPFMGRPGLTKKVITEKTGKQNTHWVSTGGDEPRGNNPAAPAEPQAKPPHKNAAKTGDQVRFKAGDFSGKGTVVGTPGADGAHVKDSSGRQHLVKWDEIVTKPDYPAREEGEEDKAYAKRAVDTQASPKDLPEEHDRYFHTEGATTVDMDNLHSTKTDDENKQGGDNAPKRMEAAYHGVLGKRPPITVAPHPEKPGHYQVLDGNGTYTGAKNAGWKRLPVTVVNAAEHKAKELAKTVADPDAKEYRGLPKKALQPSNDRDELLDLAKEGLEQLTDWLDRGKGIASKAGCRTMTQGPDDVAAAEWAKPGGMLFIAKNKTDSEKGMKRAMEKVATYGGNWNQLTDIVRCTMAVDNLNDMANLMESLKASGMEVAQRPKNKFLRPTDEGYVDINLIVTMENGCRAEVQLNVKDMMLAKNVAHPHYEITRKIVDKYGVEDVPKEKWHADEWEEGDWQRYKAAYDKQCEIYGDAWEKHVATHYGDKSKMIKSLRRVMLIFGGDHGLRVS